MTQRSALPRPSLIAPSCTFSNVNVEPLQTPRDRTSIALRDSLHYLYFLARHHLCALLGSTPLAWHGTVPPPVVDQAAAEQAVKSVLKGVARASREEGWESWERAFEDVNTAGKNGRSEVENQVRALWASSLGRGWADGLAGNAVAVELE